MESNVNACTENATALKQVQNLLVSGCFVIPVLYWIGFIGTGPLEWLQNMGIISAPSTYNISGLFSSMERLTFWVFGGAAWAILSAMFLMPFSRRIAITVLGSEAALNSAKQAIFDAETTPIPVGNLLTVTVNRGGFMSHDETIVETTQGLYRVYGKVGSVHKGSAVTQLDGGLQITTTENILKRYIMLK